MALVSQFQDRFRSLRSGVDAVAAPVGGWLMRPGDFLVFIVVLMAALWALKGLAFPGTGGDDGEQLIFSQDFRLGYQLDNPPLYTWMMIGIAKLWTPSLAAAAALKFSLLLAFYVAYWRLALWTLLDGRLAAAAALAPLAIFPLGWEAVTGLSHTVLVSLAYVLTALALLRLDHFGRWGDYAVLGIVLGMGLLAKYAFGVFALALLGAALLDPLSRERLLNRRMLLTLGLAAAVVTPHAVWLGQAWLAVGVEAIAGDATPYWRRVAGALLDAVRGGAGFLLPLLVLMPLLMPQGFHALKGDAPDMGPRARARRLLGRQLLLMIAVIAVGILVLPPERLRTHHFFLFLLAPLWWAARAKAAGAPEQAFRRVAVLGGVAGLLALAGLGAKYALEPLWGCDDACQRHIPYADLARDLEDAGFRGGTVVAYWHPDPLPGNLRAVLPGARVISVKHPRFVPPRAPASNGDCLVVWPATAGPDAERASVQTARSLFRVTLPPERSPDTVTAPLAGLGDGDYTLSYHLLRGGSGDCR